MTDGVLLRTDSLVKTFGGTVVLDKVSAELRKGEVHGIVGGNGAGKSTLMKIISGVHRPDSGSIFFEGKEVTFRTPRDAQQHGISMVYQELALCPDLTVAENIFIERLPSRAGMVDEKQLYRDTLRVLEPFQTDILPDQRVADLTVAKQQIVEIAKAVSMDSKAIIFDEPTSSLNENEAELLFELIRKLADSGIGIYYISHKLSELFAICDRITVLRDGQYITTLNIEDATTDKIVSAMVGRKIEQFYPEKSSRADGEEIFRVEDFTRLPKFKNISFSLRQGEILGLYGLVGAGRTEAARAICGIDPATSGRVYLKGKQVGIRDYADALQHGICYLSEDRKRDGLFVEMDVLNNMIAPQVDRIARRKMLLNRVIRNLVLEYKDRLNIKFASFEQQVAHLSGGNQQKLMIAKLLALNPNVIILDEPTRGIDIGSKSEIHNNLRKLSRQGIGIIIISSEMPEIVGSCDRVVVMHEGELVGELAGQDISQDNIIQVISESRQQEAKRHETA